MSSDHFDVIVVGLGVMGTSTCMELSRRGLAVLGLEQFTAGHGLGSSHGQTRVIRKAYFEDPRYVPMVKRSFELWRELEADSGKTLLYPAGCLNIGPAEHPAIRGVRRSVEEHQLPHEVLSAAQISQRWPVFQLQPDDVAVYEADAGVLLAEACTKAILDIARCCGAELQFESRLLTWQCNSAGIVVETEAETFEADVLVITAGAWLPKLVEDLHIPLTVERQVQLWFEPEQPAMFEREKMPIFIHFDADRSYYGIPIVGGDPPFDRALKIARHHGGQITTAEEVDRSVRSEDENDVRSFIRERLPQADGRLVTSKVCLYTNTADNHFIIRRHADHRRVVIGGGFSGHGFKFAPLVGEMLADLVTTDSATP